MLCAIRFRRRRFHLLGMEWGLHGFHVTPYSSSARLDSTRLAIEHRSSIGHDRKPSISRHCFRPRCEYSSIVPRAYIREAVFTAAAFHSCSSSFPDASFLHFARPSTKTRDTPTASERLHCRRVVDRPTQSAAMHACAAVSCSIAVAVSDDVQIIVCWPIGCRN